jgi:hypothetical protein
MRSSCRSSDVCRVGAPNEAELESSGIPMLLANRSMSELLGTDSVKFQGPERDGASTRMLETNDYSPHPH